MIKYNDLKVKYTHFAMPSIGIELDRVYTVSASKDKISIMTDRGEELILSEYLLTVLFSPIDGEWMDINSK